MRIEAEIPISYLERRFLQDLSEENSWMGYIYRYWHYYKDESSKKIYQQANAKTMKRNYMMFHTMDPELAIEDLIEIKRQKRNK